MNPSSRLWWTFAITSLALFAFTLDRLVVAIALPAIRADLSAQVSGLEWTVNAYTLSFAVLLLTGLGATPLQAGLRTLPMAVMPFLLAPTGGYLTDRIGFRPLMIGGLAMMSVALGWLAAVVTPTVSYGLLVPPLVLAGAGIAVFFAPLTTAMLSAVAPEEHGQASGAATAIRELAAVFGVAVLGLVFAGAPVFAFHTASFMTKAIALYERLGYRRAPDFDFDMAARYSRFDAAPIMSIAYLRHLAPVGACVPASRCA